MRLLSIYIAIERVWSVRMLRVRVLRLAWE